MRRGRAVALLVCALLLAGCRRASPQFPAETTPEGAYARISVALSEDRLRDVFAYLEDEAQWASHTIQRERATAVSRARRAFPSESFQEVARDYGADAAAADGADVFVRIGRARGWFSRLRRDLSGVAAIEKVGDRATITTARGSRYPFRRRTVGIWGLTAFTAELAADAERATRDRMRIEEAARDYEASAKRATP